MPNITTDSQGNVIIPSSVTYAPEQINATIEAIKSEMASVQERLALWESYKAASDAALNPPAPAQ